MTSLSLVSWTITDDAHTTGAVVTSEVGPDADLTGSPTVNADSITLDGADDNIKADGISMPGAGDFTLLCDFSVASEVSSIVLGLANTCLLTFDFTTYSADGDNTFGVHFGIAESPFYETFFLTYNPSLDTRYRLVYLHTGGAPMVGRLQLFSASGALLDEASHTFTGTSTIGTAGVGAPGGNDYLNHAFSAVLGQGKIFQRAYWARVLGQAELGDPFGSNVSRDITHPVVVVEVQPKGEGIPREDVLAWRFPLDDRADNSGILNLRDAVSGAESLPASGLSPKADGRGRVANAVSATGAADTGARFVDAVTELSDDAFSISFSVKPAAVGGASRGVVSILGPYLEVEVLSTGKLRVTIGPTGAATSEDTVTATLANGAWAHVTLACAKVTTTTEIDVYVDGAFVETITVADTLNPVTGVNIYLATGTDSSGSVVLERPFSGTLEHVMVWNGVTLSADEAAQLYRWVHWSRFRATSAAEPIDSLPSSVRRIQPITSRFDVEAGIEEAAQIEVELVADGWIEALQEEFLLYGATVRLWLGDSRWRGLAEYTQIFTGSVDEVVPSSTGHALRTTSLGPATLDVDIYPSVLGHPQEIAAEIIRRAAAAHGFTALAIAALTDASTFDASLDATRSHWNMARNQPTYEPFVDDNGGEVPSPEPAMAGLSALMSVMPARLTQSATGAYGWSWIDLDGEVDHLLAPEDLTAAPEVTHGSFAGICNSITLRAEIASDGDTQTAILHPQPPPVSDQWWTPTVAKEAKYSAFEVEFTNAASITAIGKKTPTNLRTSPWLSGVHDIHSTDALPDEVGIQGAPFLQGVCGFALPRTRGQGVTQESWRELDAAAGRSLYVFVPLLTSGPTAERREPQIFRADVARSDPDALTASPIDGDAYAELGYVGSPDVPGNRLGYDIAERGLFDSDATEIAFPVGTRVWDVTIAADFAAYYLRRFGGGCPGLRIRTPLSKLNIELAQLVAIDYPLLPLARFGVGRALSAVTVWEVVGKSIDPFGSPPGLEFELRWLRDDLSEAVDPSAGRTLSTVPVLDPVGPAHFVAYSAPFPDITAAGLVITFEGGAIRYGSTLYPLPDFTFTAAATSDSWVSYNLRAGRYEVITTGVGDPDPESRPWWVVLIATVETDATDLVIAFPQIGTLDDGGGLSGTAISGLIPASSIPTAGVDDTQIVRRGTGSVTTTDATATNVVGFSCPDDSVILVEARVTGRNTAAEAQTTTIVRGTMHRWSGGNVVLDDSTSDYTDGPWSAAWTVSGVDSITLKVTGAAATTIDWVARYEYEVTT